MSFTPKQQAHYRPMVSKAWLAHCAQQGIAPNNEAFRAEWYRAELIAAGGWYTTKQCDHVKDFDTVMLHFALIANDDYWITRIAHSDQRRQFWLINLRLKELSELEHTEHTWEYARSIYHHMNLPLHMRDCPADLLWKVFQALDTHVRRLQARHPPPPPLPAENRVINHQEHIPF